ncbi:MAG: LamG domain-containing protein [Cellvibrionaceae bacterium]
MLSLNQLSALAVKVVSVGAVAIILSACGGSSGGSSGGNTTTTTTNNPDNPSTAPETINYSGPAPSSEEVQRYRNGIWSNVALSSRCGACHVQGGSAVPTFARTDDINAAYSQAISNNLIDPSNAANSRLVTKVAEGHNCWLSNVNSCTSLMTTWVGQYLAVAGDTSFLGALNLQEPTLQTVGNSKQFPALGDDGSATDFESTVYQLTSVYCSSCHSENSSLRQQPFIGSDDVEVAYEAARSRMNLEDGGTVTVAEAVSRLTLRLRDEGHNCWTGNCSTDSASMHAAIQTFSDAITPTAVDPDLVISRALTLDDGQTAASGGGRIETNVIAKWEFRDGSGATSADDTSGISPAMPLSLRGNVEWLASGGVRINDGKLQGTTSTSAKLYDRITSSGEFTIEGWFVPLNVTQDGPARIVTYSGDTDRRNFMLGQTLYDYDFQVRSSVTDSDGLPAVSTPSDDEVLQATLQHVAVTYSAIDGRRIYVNGQLESVAPEVDGAGNFNSWDRNFVLAVGDEVSDDNQWQGTVRFLAIHDAAMSAEDIQTNYDIGVGQKFYLLFYISDHVGIPRSYIVMQVEQFDDYGYLFNEPFFVTFDSTATISSFPIQGMRIGLNGQEASAGQAYANLDTTVTQADVDAQEGRQVLSNVGTIIGVDQGPVADQFFLTFDQLGGSSYVRVEATPTPQLPTPSTDAQSDVGVKTFDEINEALSSLTGISRTNTEVASTFETVKQQLPVDPAIDGFAASQQMAVTQLAVLYCKELVDQESALANSTYFPGFDFDATPTAAFDATGRDQIISPLLDQLLANTTQSDDQVASADARTELDGLITTLLGNCDNDSCLPAGNTSTRVNSIVTATCATAYGSGMMLIQ